MHGGYTFTKKHGAGSQNRTNITVEVCSEHCGLDDILEAFTSFLAASGFQLQAPIGELEPEAIDRVITLRQVENAIHQYYLAGIARQMDDALESGIVDGGEEQLVNWMHSHFGNGV